MRLARRGRGMRGIGGVALALVLALAAPIAAQDLKKDLEKIVKDGSDGISKRLAEVIKKHFDARIAKLEAELIKSRETLQKSKGTIAQGKKRIAKRCSSVLRRLNWISANSWPS